MTDFDPMLTNLQTIKVCYEIEKERQNQDRMWGEQNHDDGYWTGILGEEFGEVCKAAIESESTATDLREELIQVAAVAVAWVECIDRRRLSEE